MVWSSGLIGHQTLKTLGESEVENAVVPETTAVHHQYDRNAVFGDAIWKAGIGWDFETARGLNRTGSLIPRITIGRERDLPKLPNQGCRMGHCCGL